jgi:5'-nucleotidase
LEVSVSMYPNLAGRYMAFSGIGFSWDASKKPMERVLPETIKIHEQPLQKERVYKVAMHSFVGDGGDGYACLKECAEIAS